MQISDKFAEDAESSMHRAKGSASNAEASESQAKESANSARSSESQATTYADRAFEQIDIAKKNKEALEALLEQHQNSANEAKNVFYEATNHYNQGVIDASQAESDAISTDIIVQMVIEFRNSKRERYADE